MTNEMKNEIRDLLEKQIDAKRVSQNVAATQIGITGGYLSAIMNKKWAKIAPKTWNKCAAWVGYTTKDWTIRETQNLKTVVDLCNGAQMNGRFMALAAPTGFGKTVGLKHYAKNNTDVAYILGTIDMVRGDFLNSMAQSLGIEVEGSIFKRRNKILSHLKKLEQPLLIIDDFGKLNIGCMRLLQIFYDEFNGELGIVVSGLPEMMELIFKQAAKGAIAFPELKRRIGYWQTLKKVSPKFIETVAADFGITEEDAINYLISKCEDYGTLKELLITYSDVDNAKRDGLNQREVLAGIQVGHDNIQITSRKKRAA